MRRPGLGPAFDRQVGEPRTEHPDGDVGAEAVPAEPAARLCREPDGPPAPRRTGDQVLQGVVQTLGVERPAGMPDQGLHRAAPCSGALTDPGSVLVSCIRTPSSPAGVVRTSACGLIACTNARAVSSSLLSTTAFACSSCRAITSAMARPSSAAVEIPRSWINWSPVR